MSLCLKHNKDLEFFCSTSDCLKAICKKCMTEHMGHSIIPIEDIIEEIENTEKKTIYQLNENKSILESNYQQANTLIYELEKNQNENINNIRLNLERFNEFISLKIKNIESDNLNKKEKFVYLIKKLELSIEDVKKLIALAEKDKNLYKENLENKNFIEIYKYYKNENLKLEDYNEIKEEIKNLKDLIQGFNDPSLFLIQEFLKLLNFDTYSTEKLDEFSQKINGLQEIFNATKNQLNLIQEEIYSKKTELSFIKNEINEFDKKKKENSGFLINNINDESKNLNLLITKENNNYFNKLDLIYDYISEKNPTHFDFKSNIALEFDTDFNGFEYNLNRLICKRNTNDNYFYTFCPQVLSKNNLEKYIWYIELDGICENTLIGIMERKNDELYKKSKISNNGSNSIHSFSYSNNLECFWIKSNGNISNNFSNFSNFPIDNNHKFDKGKHLFKFELDFNNGIFSIRNESSSIRLKGSITKNEYIFGFTGFSKNKICRLLKN